jgi:hypothetical protein
MALNPKMHVTLTIEELEDIKNSAMQRAEDMEWQLRLELQKVREIERNLSRILGEASQVPAAAPGVARGTPMHGTPLPPSVPSVKPAAAPVAAPAAAPVAAPLPAAKTMPNVRPSWTPPPPPVSTTSSTSTSVVRRLPPPPPPLPANVHRMNPVNPARKA